LVPAKFAFTSVRSASIELRHSTPSGQLGPVSFPARIGYEAAGVVVEVGERVESWVPGDWVATLFGLPMEEYGTHAEEIVFPADWLVGVPVGQSLADAAATWMQFGTALALIELADIGPGDFVLINAASSSVGIVAIQIARERGAIPIALTRTQAKVEALRSLGADAVIVGGGEDRERGCCSMPWRARTLKSAWLLSPRWVPPSSMTCREEPQRQFLPL
jgi:NADPH:quinone reductase-like Zn-dependent oxidoreductase